MSTAIWARNVTSVKSIFVGCVAQPLLDDSRATNMLRNARSVHSEWWLEGKASPAETPALYQMMLSPVRGLYDISPSWLKRFDEHIRLHDRGGSLDEQMRGALLGGV